MAFMASKFNLHESKEIIKKDFHSLFSEFGNHADCRNYVLLGMQELCINYVFFSETWKCVFMSCTQKPALD